MQALVGYWHRKENLMELILEASRDGASKSQILKKARHWQESQVDEFISHSIKLKLLQSHGEMYRTTERGLCCLKSWHENKALLEPYYAPKPRGLPSWFP